jgi:hypothetical protein
MHSALQKTMAHQVPLAVSGDFVIEVYVRGVMLGGRNVHLLLAGYFSLIRNLTFGYVNYCSSDFFQSGIPIIGFIVGVVERLLPFGFNFFVKGFLITNCIDKCHIFSLNH